MHFKAPNSHQQNDRKENLNHLLFMKILEVNKFFFGKRGAERHFFDLCRLWEERGNTVAVFAMQHPDNQPFPWEKYFLSRVGYHQDGSSLQEKLIGIGRLFWSFEARTKMRALLRDFAPDIVHVHNAYHQLSLAFFPLVKKAGVLLLLTAHDYAVISPDKDRYYPEVGRQYWKFLGIQKYSLGKRVLLVLKKYWEDWMGFYACVDRFVVPSEYVAQVFVSAGMERSKITVLPHFIFPELPVASAPQDIKLPDRFLFYFGAVTEGKGVNDLARMSERLAIPLVVAGSIDPDFPVYTGPMVDYIGPRSQSELRYLIEQASCVVNASTLPETFGLTALETIALGKPFFTLKSGALSEIIQHGENGFVAEDLSELETLVKTLLAGNLFLAGAEHIAEKVRERYGAQQYAERFENIVKELK